MDRAVGLAAKILGEFEHGVSSLEIVPSGGGVFEVDVDGRRVFSKKQLGRHADPEEVLAEIRAGTADR